MKRLGGLKLDESKKDRRERKRHEEGDGKDGDIGDMPTDEFINKIKYEIDNYVK